MKTLILLCLAFGLLAVTAQKAEYDEQWEEYKIEFNKTYESPFDEEERRLIWELNLEFINKHNQEADEGLSSFYLKINAFSDMSEDEFAETHTGLWDGFGEEIEEDSDFSSNETLGFPEYKQLPSSVDWRERNILAPVKNQGRCGSCWAFAAVATIEAQHALNTGQRVSLSEQNLLDCTSFSFGCNGGIPSEAFKYVLRNRGIATEEAYPYEGRKEMCRYNQRQKGATLSSYRRVDRRGGELALQRAVATVGPIVVVMHAEHVPELRNYWQGILDTQACMNKRTDHAVVAVGYGTLDGKDYWIIRNSWGKRWGIDGYLYLARNKNMCGIAQKGVYPVV